MGDPAGAAAGAASGGGKSGGGGDAGGGGGGFDPGAGMGGLDPSLGFGGGDPSMGGGGMGNTFGSFDGPIPGDPTGSLRAQQSVMGAVPGSQPPLTDQPSPASGGPGQPQQQTPPQPPQQHQSASEALFHGLTVPSSTPGGQQVASLGRSDVTPIDQGYAGLDQSTDLMKLASANMPVPPQPSQPAFPGGGTTTPKLPPAPPPEQPQPPSPETDPNASSDSSKIGGGGPATSPSNIPIPQERPATGQDLGTSTSAVPSSTVTPPGTPPDLGGGQGQQSPLEQLVGQFLHMLMGGQGGMGGLEQMLIRALGMNPRQMFPQYYGGGFIPPLPRPGSGYFPPGTTDGRAVASGGPQSLMQGGVPRLPQPRTPPGMPRTPGNQPSALPLPPRRPSFPSAAGGTEDIPRPPGEIGGGTAGYNPSSYTKALFRVESNNNPNEITKGNYGLGQFSKDQWKHFGITEQNWRNPQVMTRAVQQEARENTPRMRAALGRDPTPAELYLAHQQNVPEAIAMIKNPNAPAWQVVRQFYHSDRAGLSAISNNMPIRGIPASQITAGQFVNGWRNKFNQFVQ